jgi:hypothetical protein
MSDHESIQECTNSNTITPSKSGKKKARRMKDCSELLEKIKELIDKEKQNRLGTKGLKQRFRDYKGDDTVHGLEIQKQQRCLQAFIEEFIDRGCGDPPNGAYEWATKPLPAPSTDVAKNVAKATIVTGAAIGASYLIYRTIRFLPSLAPPLWPTIPLNLAVP